MFEHRARWMIVSLPMSILLLFCSSPDGGGTSGSGSGAAAVATGSGGAAVGSTGQGGDFIQPVGSGGAMPPKNMPVPVADAGIDAQAAPAAACGPDAGTDVMCELPPSYCADLQWLVFYQNPTCVDGACQYEAWALYCDVSYVCVNGGCELNVTL